MTWNHRVVKEILEDGAVYAVWGCGVGVCGESINEIKEYLQWCLECLEQPILEDGKVEFVDPDVDVAEATHD